MNKPLENLVDELGTLLAEKAEIEKRERAIKTELKGFTAAAGIKHLDGSLFRATIVESIRKTLDMKAVRAKLTRQFITANTNESESVSVRVVSL